MRKLVHISDLHFGRIDYKTVDALEEAVHGVGPHVVAVSGDLTQRARAWQFREAARFLERLSYPKVVVPGNHDVPLFNLVQRVIDPLGGFRKYISAETEPQYEDDELVIVGISTPHTYPVDAGRVRSSSLERLERRLGAVPATKARIIVSHHPLDALGGRASYPERRGRIPAGPLLGLAPDVLLAGHWHESSARASATMATVDHRSFLVVQGGTSTSTRQRGEGNAFNVLEIDEGHIGITHYERDSGNRFQPRESFHFSLTSRGWLPATDT